MKTIERFGVLALGFASCTVACGSESAEPSKFGAATQSSSASQSPSSSSGVSTSTGNETSSTTNGVATSASTTSTSSGTTGSASAVTSVGMATTVSGVSSGGGSSATDASSVGGSSSSATPVTSGGGLPGAGGTGGTPAVDPACLELESEYAASLEEQRACTLDQSPCDDFAALRPGCGNCRVAIEPKDLFAIENLLNVEDAWFRADCPPPECPVDCPSTAGASCQVDPLDASQGRCQP